MMLAKITKSRKSFEKIISLKLQPLNSVQIDYPVRGVVTHANISHTQVSLMAFCQVELLSESSYGANSGNGILTDSHNIA